MTDNTIQVEIRNLWGRTVAYPKDIYAEAMLRLKDQYDADGYVSKKALCFVAGDMPSLRHIAELLNARVEEVYRKEVNGKTLENWKKRSKRRRDAKVPEEMQHEKESKESTSEK